MELGICKTLSKCGVNGGVWKEPYHAPWPLGFEAVTFLSIGANSKLIYIHHSTRSIAAQTTLPAGAGEGI